MCIPNVRCQLINKEVLLQVLCFYGMWYYITQVTHPIETDTATAPLQMATPRSSFINFGHKTEPFFVVGSY